MTALRELAGRWRPSRSFTLALLVLAAAALRLGLLWANLIQSGDFYTRDGRETVAELSRGDRPRMFVGMELSNIACAAVCTGQGYASPFGGATGPTAWGAPGLVLPYILGFKLFGCFSVGSSLVAWGVMLAASLVTLVLTERLATAVLDDPRAGLVAAGLFVVSPFDAWAFRIKDVMDLNLPALALAAVALAAVRFLRAPGMRAAVVLGLIGGLATLVNPGFAASALLPLCFEPRSPRRLLGRAVTVVGALALVVAPYLVAQRAWLGRWVFVKSNAPFEVYFGNTPTSRGLLRPEAFEALHPSQNVDAFRRFGELGEAAYIAERFAEFRATVGPAQLAANTTRRFANFFWAADAKVWDRSPWRVAAKRVLWAWLGGIFLVFAAWRRLRLRRSEALLFLLAAAYAAPFMITGIMERYRVVIAPVSIVLMAGLLVAVLDAVRSRTARRGLDGSPGSRARR